MGFGCATADMVFVNCNKLVLEVCCFVWLLMLQLGFGLAQTLQYYCISTDCVAVDTEGSLLQLQMRHDK